MDETRWNQVDDYLAGALLGADDTLAQVLQRCEAAGLPEIQVSATLGKFLELLVRVSGARRILELGTLGGYSTICLARGLSPGGKVVTLELDSKHAEAARANFAAAGLSLVVELREGPALQTLAALVREKVEPFDFIFIDADKDNYPSYLSFALQLARAGTVILADNVIRQGAVVEPGHGDPRVQAVREFLRLAASEPRLNATALQTVGHKGYDGFFLAVVR